MFRSRPSIKPPPTRWARSCGDPRPRYLQRALIAPWMMFSIKRPVLLAISFGMLAFTSSCDSGLLEGDGPDIKYGVGVIDHSMEWGGFGVYVPYASFRLGFSGVSRIQPGIHSAFKAGGPRDIFPYDQRRFGMTYGPRLFPLARPDTPAATSQTARFVWVSTSLERPSVQLGRAVALIAFWSPQSGFADLPPHEVLLLDDRRVDWCIAVDPSGLPELSTESSLDGWILLGGARNRGASGGGRTGWVHVVVFSGNRVVEEPSAGAVLTALGLDPEAFAAGEIYVTPTQTHDGPVHGVLKISEAGCQLWKFANGRITPVEVSPFRSKEILKPRSELTEYSPFLTGPPKVLRYGQ